MRLHIYFSWTYSGFSIFIWANILFSFPKLIGNHYGLSWLSLRLCEERTCKCLDEIYSTEEFSDNWILKSARREIWRRRRERAKAVDAFVILTKATNIPLMNSTCEVDYWIMCWLRHWLVEHKLYITDSSASSTWYIVYYYYYYYYYYYHHLISQFSALAGKFSPILGCGNQQD